MDQHPAHEDWDEDGLPVGETPERRAAREAREAELVAQSRAQAADGYYLLAHELEAWFKALEHTPDAPIPQPSKRSPLF